MFGVGQVGDREPLYDMLPRYQVKYLKSGSECKWLHIFYNLSHILHMKLSILHIFSMYYAVLSFVPQRLFFWTPCICSFFSFKKKNFFFYKLWKSCWRWHYSCHYYRHYTYFKFKGTLVPSHKVLFLLYRVYCQWLYIYNGMYMYMYDLNLLFYCNMDIQRIWKIDIFKWSLD